MTPANDFDRSLSAWLHERAQPQAPDHLREAAVAQAVSARPRPAWRIPERWIPMPITLRLAVVPRAALLLLLLALCVALATTTIVVGSRLNLFAATALPAPVGPAGNGLIAYQSGGDIWVVDPSSADAPRQLTSGPAYDARPRWSPDGTRLAYWSSASRDAVPSNLIVVNKDGTSPVTIATEIEGTIDDLAPVDWSPNGKHVVYASNGIVVAATDRADSRQVGNPTLLVWGPDWSPDGTQLAFGGGTSAGHGVYVMSPDGSNVQQLSQIQDVEDMSFRRVEWSPDGTRIASDTTPVGSLGRIWVFEADGTGESEVAGTPPGSILPSWSPAGDRIAFWAGPNRLSVIPADGGTPMLLNGSIDDTSWSPDGTAILGVLQSGIGVIDAITGDILWELPLSLVQIVDPTWQRVAK
jgi:Tol biopolymer transport system component